jgi:hypothetical protein
MGYGDGVENEKAANTAQVAIAFRSTYPYNYGQLSILYSAEGGAYGNIYPQ